MCCATTDYAMQSVLMQMGLKLLSVDGMVLRSTSTGAHRGAARPRARGGQPRHALLTPRHRPLQVLRCSGCFTRQQSLDRRPAQCGNASLVRLQMVINAEVRTRPSHTPLAAHGPRLLHQPAPLPPGHQRIPPEGKAPARVRSTNVRGTKFAMPAPQSGRHAKNLILAEDQLAEAREKARRQGKMKSFDVFDPDYDNEAHFGRTGKKGGARGGALQVGYGKRNPNDVRSRTKKR